MSKYVSEQPGSSDQQKITQMVRRSKRLSRDMEVDGEKFAQMTIADGDDKNNKAGKVPKRSALGNISNKPLDDGKKPGASEGVLKPLQQQQKPKPKRKEDGEDEENEQINGAGLSKSIASLDIRSPKAHLGVEEEAVPAIAQAAARPSVSAAPAAPAAPAAAPGAAASAPMAIGGGVTQEASVRVSSPPDGLHMSASLQPPTAPIASAMDVSDEKDKMDDDEGDKKGAVSPPSSHHGHHGHPTAAEDAKVLEGIPLAVIEELGSIGHLTIDIHHELRKNELKYRPRQDYMESIQKDVNPVMRGILVDWLVEVAGEYKVCPQTLFLTVSYVDRLLSGVSVHRTKLQLIGITCMLLASKYEEIYPPSVDDFVYIADNTYTRDEVLRMETVLLNTLKFALTNVTVWEFARRYCKLAGVDVKTAHLVHYLSELFLQEIDYVKLLPSKIAAACCYVANATLDQTPWPAALRHASAYDLEDIKEAIVAVHGVYLKMQRGKTTLKAVKNKYSEDRRMKVAAITCPDSLKGFPTPP